jgi:hypothetical protein
MDEAFIKIPISLAFLSLLFAATLVTEFTMRPAWQQKPRTKILYILVL